MTDFWLGVLSSLIGAIVGATLTFLITWFFSWRDKSKQNNIIWYAVREEITSNYSLAKQWLEHVQKELVIIQRGEDYYLADILPFFKSSSFNKVMYSLPKKLKKDPMLFNNLRVISQNFDNLNEIIQNIKEYKGPVKITNEMKMIGMFDKMLKRDILQVIELINEHYDDIIIKDKEIKDELKKIS